MFIRSKTISNKNYAYLVRTRWDKRSKKVKQKVSKYLGPIKKLDKVKDKDFFEYYNHERDNYINNVKMKDLIRDLVEHELYKHGFLRLGKYKMSNGLIEVNPDKVEKVFELNEGFLNRHTLREIERYDKILDEKESKIPYKFAALFVNAGLDIDQSLFVELYQRFFSSTLPSEKIEEEIENFDY
jgi:hypothetical protein